MQVPGSNIKFVFSDMFVLIIYFIFDEGWICCTSFSEEVEDVGVFLLFFFQKTLREWGSISHGWRHVVPLESNDTGFLILLFSNFKW